MKARPRRQGVFTKLATLYSDMESAYARTAATLDFSCQGCTDNCCDSYFMHHTYIEWAYLWRGLSELSKNRLDVVLARARGYEDASAEALARNERPSEPCPLLDLAAGRCELYAHRMMICRMHGVAHTLARRGLPSAEYPGCFRYEALRKERPYAPVMDRTPFYIRLAELERSYLGSGYGKLPKVDMTLAGMIIAGPPAFKGPADKE